MIKQFSFKVKCHFKAASGENNMKIFSFMNYRLSFENSIENYSNLISHIYIITEDWYMKTLLTNKTRKK